MPVSVEVPSTFDILSGGLRYENLHGILVRRDMLLHWVCPECQAQGSSKQVRRTCPKCGFGRKDRGK